ncbi:hypothetical protein [Agrococcus sp. UYP10]|uniref:hypothetical protein n=1 Tax=Agrococcus sp. UYP10 TaxID=1756355 RepID=UPI00339A1081
MPMLLLCAAALAVSLLCVLAAGRAPRALLPVAALMAGVPTIATCLLLLGPARATDAALAQSGGLPPERSALDLWMSSAGLASGWVGLAAICVAVGTWLLVRGRAPAVARSLSRAGTVALLLSCASTLGGTLAPAVVGTAIACAATGVAAAYGRELAAGTRADLHPRAPAA